MKFNLYNYWIRFLTPIYMLLTLYGSVFPLLQNIALRRGQRLTLQCTVDEKSFTQFFGWFHFRVRSNSERVIFTPSNGISPEYRNRTEVTITNGSSVLTVDDVQMTDAGTYGCKTSKNSVLTHERARVIIFDGGLKLYNINSSLISCESIFNGDLEPKLQLNESESGTVIATQTQQNSFNLSNGSQKVLVQLEIESFQIRNSTYNCQLRFSNSDFSIQHIATNIPAYEEIVTLELNAYNDTWDQQNITETTSDNSTTANEEEVIEVKPISFIFISSVSIGIVVVVVVIIVVIILVMKRRSKRKRRVAEHRSDRQSWSLIVPQHCSSRIRSNFQPVDLRPGYEEMQSEAKTPTFEDYVRLAKTQGQPRDRAMSSEDKRDIGGPRPSYFNVNIDNYKVATPGEKLVKHSYENVASEKKEEVKETPSHSYVNVFHL